MPALRDIRRRINAVRSIQKITKAMKMVAAARLRRAQERIISARPYAKRIEEIIQRFVSVFETSQNPLLKKREVKNIGIVVVTADRGLCGSFNTNIIRAVLNLIEKRKKELPPDGKIKLICVGKKGYDYFSRHRKGIEIFAGYPGVFKRTIEISDVREIMSKVVGGFLSGEFDKVEIVYNEFKSIVQQRIVIEDFLPIVPKFEAVKPSKGVKVPLVEYIYEPAPIEILNSLLPKYLETHILRVLLESNAAEQAARMTAMDNATENANELLRDLQLLFNKTRQALITKEMLEIAGGAEALRKAGAS
ncbi:ATP synthase F1 subcomplex gamma subunit [Candidatus Thermokryptus mobilis]|uniref:ATP synthase gamma chain n=1 Tax=Candidatus Thermokryptus mobilis TaxID=1643428 RepID=A0A0S4MUG2_9BACT|nr:ATP synthase F1 subunit gamma [Candidatus Thermokryptus mobilis]CUU01409.1 ATP synthase F1 subcomplex gamma subunit [Candidatus Thermokryptus mobilis]